MKTFTKTLLILVLGFPILAKASHWQLYNQTTTYTSVESCTDIQLNGQPWIMYSTVTYYPDHILYTTYAYPKHLEEIDEDIKHVTDRSCVSNPLRVKKIDSWYVLVP